MIIIAQLEQATAELSPPLQLVLNHFYVAWEAEALEAISALLQFRASLAPAGSNGI